MRPPRTALISVRTYNILPNLTREQTMSNTLTDAQQRLVQLDLRKKEIDSFYEELEQALTDVVAEIGVGSYFQSGDGTVYKVVKPTGTFVSFRDLAYNRTKREGEDRGTLSVKEAQSAGFNVK